MSLSVYTLKGINASQERLCYLLSKNYKSACAICWENIILHSHPEIEISFKFIPKILMSKECIHFLGPICILEWGGRGSSVGIATELRAGHPADRIPVGARFSALVHIGPGGQPASCKNRVFTAGKAAGAWRWPPTRTYCQSQRKSRAISYFPSGPSWPVLGWTVLYFYCMCIYSTGETALTFTNTAFCPHSVFMCFMWIWEQTAIISLYSINWLVFIAETECVYCAVRLGFYI